MRTWKWREATGAGGPAAHTTHPRECETRPDAGEPSREPASLWSPHRTVSVSVWDRRCGRAGAGRGTVLPHTPRLHTHAGLGLPPGSGRVVGPSVAVGTQCAGAGVVGPSRCRPPPRGQHPSLTQGSREPPGKEDSGVSGNPGRGPLWVPRAQAHSSGSARRLWAGLTYRVGRKGSTPPGRSRPQRAPAALPWELVNIPQTSLST